MLHRETLVTRFDPDASSHQPILNIRLGFNWRPYAVIGEVSRETVRDAVSCVRATELLDNTPTRVTIDGLWREVTPITAA